MRRWMSLVLGLALALPLAGCGREEPPPPPRVEPSMEQIRDICELSVMECYYNNVAKFYDEDAVGHLWWKKDKHFWIEYDCIVSLGVDVSDVKLDIRGENITITLPRAKVLDMKVNQESMDFIVDQKSAPVTGQDQVLAMGEAQTQLEQLVREDDLLLGEAEARVEQLLRSYVANLMNPAGQAYELKFEYLPEETPEPQPVTTPAQS